MSATCTHGDEIGNIVKMNLTVNGESRPAADGATVRSLLVELGMGEQPAAVELNRAVVPRSKHELTELKDGDVIEIVTLVGGG